MEASGFSQKEGVDYDDVFAPLVRYNSLRLVLWVANDLDMEVHQMKVKTAFLNGDLEEAIYMLPLNGSEDQHHFDSVWKLKNGL